jgi:signal transduction histidine kinase
VRRPDLVDAGLAAGSLGVALLTTDRDDPDRAVSVVFATLLTLLLGLVLRHAWSAAVAARGEQRRARSLRAVDPSASALAAVLEERARLARELDRSIREALTAMAGELTGGESDADPRARAQRLQRRAREASSELRRQLGLLRGEQPAATPAPPVGEERRLTGRDIWLAAVVSVLAAAENLGYWATGEFASGAFVPALSVPLTALAAATVVTWRTAPVHGAVALAALLVLPAAAADVMVGSGAWMVATLGCLTWGLAVRGPRDGRAVLAAGLLAAAVGWSRLRDDPDNAAIALVLIAVAWLTGTAVGVYRRRRARAAADALALQATLDGARAEATRAERLAVARDLHDTVSHAVGVVAVQAAAAEVSWPDRPDTARAAFRAMATTVADALAELDRVRPGAAQDSARRDLEALVARMRAAGVEVHLTCRGASAADVDPVVYRVVQEALTNAVRHAPGATVDVVVEDCVVEDAGGEVRVTVRDTGTGRSTEDRRGFGLVGLAERVALRDGTLHAGPGPDGRGFVVEATVPLRARSVR